MILVKHVLIAEGIERKLDKFDINEIYPIPEISAAASMMRKIVKSAKFTGLFEGINCLNVNSIRPVGEEPNETYDDEPGGMDALVELLKNEKIAIEKWHLRNWGCASNALDVRFSKDRLEFMTIGEMSKDVIPLLSDKKLRGTMIRYYWAESENGGDIAGVNGCSYILNGEFHVPLTEEDKTLTARKIYEICWGVKHKNPVFLQAVPSGWILPAMRDPTAAIKTVVEFCKASLGNKKGTMEFTLLDVKKMTPVITVEANPDEIYVDEYNDKDDGPYRHLGKITWRGGDIKIFDNSGRVPESYIAEKLSGLCWIYVEPEDE